MDTPSTRRLEALYPLADGYHWSFRSTIGGFVGVSIEKKTHPLGLFIRCKRISGEELLGYNDSDSYIEFIINRYLKNDPDIREAFA